MLMEVVSGILAIQAKVNQRSLLKDEHSVKQAECMWRGAVDSCHNRDTLPDQILYYLHHFMCGERIQARCWFCKAVC